MPGVPGRGGPVPKRSTQRRRANKPDVPVKTAAASPAPDAKPPPACRDWHAVARRWYQSLARSGQSAYYEPSDWATAYLLAEVISRDLATGEPVRGASVAAWLKGMTGLMVTEGERRRARVELSRPDATGGDGEGEAVSRLDEYRRRALSG